MVTNYGAVVKQYANYTGNPNDAEFRLGRQPALTALGEVGGKTILDLGCGPATNSLKLSQAGARVIGLDKSGPMIEEAQRVDSLGNYRVYRGLLAKELANVQLDGILMSFSFCVIPDREIRYMLPDMRELLVPEGKLVIIDPNQERAHGIEYRNLHYHKKEGVQTGDLVDVTLGSGVDAIHLTDDIYRRHADYVELLEEAGFTIEKMEEPMPGADWGEEWETERKYPPFLLFVAR